MTTSIDLGGFTAANRAAAPAPATVAELVASLFQSRNRQSDDLSHLRSGAFLADLVRWLGDVPIPPRNRVRAPFAVVPKIGDEKLPAIIGQFEMEVLPNGTGRVFISPFQAFAEYRGGFERLFDEVPKSVRGKSLPENHACTDVRVSLCRWSSPSLPLPANVSPYDRLRHDEQWSGGSATGAAWRALHFAWSAKIPDGDILVLAELRDRIFKGVDDLEAKVEAAANEGVDTIVVVCPKEAADTLRKKHPTLHFVNLDESASATSVY